MRIETGGKYNKREKGIKGWMCTQSGNATYKSASWKLEKEMKFWSFDLITIRFLLSTKPEAFLYSFLMCYLKYIPSAFSIVAKINKEKKRQRK